MQFSLGNRVLITNSMGLLVGNFSKAGGLFGAIFALWKVVSILLRYKYRNRQARLVEEFEFRNNING